MVFLYFNMHLVNNINIYVMYILCLIKSNDVVNMAVFISHGIILKDMLVNMFVEVHFQCFVCAESIRT